MSAHEVFFALAIHMSRLIRSGAVQSLAEICCIAVASHRAICRKVTMPMLLSIRSNAGPMPRISLRSSFGCVVEGSVYPI